MDITPYIADLLRQHDEVNVPSLGTFYKQRKSGFYDTESAEFLPPSHGLAFKETEDNFFLAEYISRQKNISASTSNYFIEKFVSQIKSQMSINGYAEIEPLGTLKKTKSGYIFTDALSFDTEGEYYGLQPVADLGDIVVQSDEAPVFSQFKDEAESEIAISEQPVEETAEEGKKLSWATKILLAPASLILIGIITYLVYPQAFETFRQKTEVPEKIPVKPTIVAPKTQNLADSLAQADTIYQELAEQGFEVEKPRDTLEVTTQAQAVNTEEVGFEIIGAAFARRTEAETYVSQLKAKGIYAKIVDNMPGSKLKISLGSFNDEASAQRELIRIKKELNKDAWIARVKPKKLNNK